jgi:hypothetical protein
MTRMAEGWYRGLRFHPSRLFVLVRLPGSTMGNALWHFLQATSETQVQPGDPPRDSRLRKYMALALGRESEPEARKIHVF